MGSHEAGRAPDEDDGHQDVDRHRGEGRADRHGRGLVHEAAEDDRQQEAAEQIKFTTQLLVDWVVVEADKLQKGKATQPAISALANTAVRVAVVPVLRHTLALMLLFKLPTTKEPASELAVKVALSAALSVTRRKLFTIVPLLLL